MTSAELSRDLEAALASNDRHACKDLSEAIDERIAARDIDEPPPVEVAAGRYTTASAQRLEVHVLDAKTDRKSTNPPSPIGGVMLKVAAEVIGANSLFGAITDGIVQDAREGRTSSEALLAAAKWLPVPGNEAEEKTGRILTPAMRRELPEATAEYERQFEWACTRARLDAIDGRYLRNHDPSFSGRDATAYVQHLAPIIARRMFRDMLGEKDRRGAADLAEGAAPSDNLWIRVAWQDARQEATVRPYRPAASENVSTPIGIAPDEPTGEQIQATGWLAITGTPPAAGEGGRWTIGEAAPLMRPRELFTAVWTGMEAGIRARQETGDKEIARVLTRLAEWMILPGPADEETEPVLREAPGLAPAIVAGYPEEAAWYEAARDRAWRLAHKQVKKGRYLRQHRTMAQLVDDDMNAWSKQKKAEGH